jgi:hypothetical protein
MKNFSASKMRIDTLWAALCPTNRLRCPSAGATLLWAYDDASLTLSTPMGERQLLRCIDIAIALFAVADRGEPRSCLQGKTDSEQAPQSVFGNLISTLELVIPAALHGRKIANEGGRHET